LGPLVALVGLSVNKALESKMVKFCSADVTRLILCFCFSVFLLGVENPTVT